MQKKVLILNLKVGNKVTKTEEFELSVMWLERWFVVPEVAGSNPVFHPELKPYFLSKAFFVAKTKATKKSPANAGD